jgi:hypothetical protein
VQTTVSSSLFRNLDFDNVFHRIEISIGILPRYAGCQDPGRNHRYHQIAKVMNVRRFRKRASFNLEDARTSDPAILHKTPESHSAALARWGSPKPWQPHRAPLLSARKAGARIIKPGEDAFWGGYHGYFQDPDGHLWEIAWNPNPATAAPAGGPGVGEKATRSPD